VAARDARLKPLGPGHDSGRAALGLSDERSARSDWRHGIPPIEAPRYSVTFRTMRV